MIIYWWIDKFFYRFSYTYMYIYIYSEQSSAYVPVIITETSEARYFRKNYSTRVFERSNIISLNFSIRCDIEHKRQTFLDNKILDSLQFLVSCDDYPRRYAAPGRSLRRCQAWWFVETEILMPRILSRACRVTPSNEWTSSPWLDADYGWWSCAPDRKWTIR